MDKLLETDPELARFVAEMEQTSRMKKTTEKLTLECWDLCITNPNVSRFDSKTESCLVNCVERFIDSSTYLVKEFSNKSQSVSSSSDFADSEMIIDDKFTLSPEPKLNEQEKKSSGFKFW
ncbi:unnamed protein product [Brachionus calyciflorus]|uniref:Mitochondrial import inner membrane translocase subunit n=1 Tax=Brachionus calyciflorus TaxID=104777 RepID=A0A813M707_9BILA|nr:unnamed protein product [Brachionus calyciflorus]